MNTRPPIEASPSEAVLSVSFNNDASCFAVGLDSGMCGKSYLRSLWMALLTVMSQSFIPSQVFSKPQEVFIFNRTLLNRSNSSADFNAGIGLVQMMGTTNYLALVGGGRSPKFAMNKVGFLSELTSNITDRTKGHNMG